MPPENGPAAGSNPGPTAATETIPNNVAISGPSRRVVNRNNITTVTDSVIILTSDDEDDSAIAENPVVDLCTPEHLTARRRRRANNFAPNEIIEIEDVFSPPANKIPKKSEIAEAEKPEPCKNVKCPVCLESPLNNTPASTKCGHVFCKDCIVMSLKNSKKCPICKRFCTEKSLLLLYI